MIANLKQPQFIVDESGNRVGVILDMESYEQLLEAMEDLDDIRAYDEAKAESGESIPLEQALKEIEDSRG
jgi:hypothetical protein